MKRMFTGWMARFLAFIAVALVFAFPVMAAQQSAVSFGEVSAQQVHGLSPGAMVHGPNTPMDGSVTTMCSYTNAPHAGADDARLSAVGQAKGSKTREAVPMTPEVVISALRTRR